jgi:hypothetical protein
MPLVKPVIQAEINKLINDTKGLEQEQAQAEFASKLADVIINALKSATVTVAVGIPVATSGGAGATSGPGTGTIS